MCGGSRPRPLMSSRCCWSKTARVTHKKRVSLSTDHAPPLFETGETQQDRRMYPYYTICERYKYLSEFEGS